MVASKARAERESGEVLAGRYRLCARLGQGGFGDVWSAEELLPDGSAFREVALKLLTQVGAGDEWAEEAKLLASLRHPALVTIYSAGLLAVPDAAGGLPFVAMELLGGETLSDVIKRRRRLPWRLALRWMRDVAAALDVIHAAGIVHLDLKPANLFLTTEGAIKVLDFGISRRVGAPPPTVRELVVPSTDELGLDATAAVGEAFEAYAATVRVEGTTTRRAIAGTPGYVAPEVLDGRPPTAASDAFALGVCLSMLTTGALPQANAAPPREWGDVAEVSAWFSALRDATVRGEMRDFAQDEPSLPRGVAALLEQLLCVDPIARFGQRASLAEALGHVWRVPHGPPRSAFPGLEPFSAQDEGALPGRDDDVARLTRDLAHQGAVIVVAPDGTGKTSIVRAGIVPSLAREAMDGKDDWYSVDVSSGSSAQLRDLLDELAPVDAPSLEAEAAETESFDVERFAERLAKGPYGIVLVADPAEEAVELAESLGGQHRDDSEGSDDEPAVDDLRGHLIRLALQTPPRNGLRFVGTLTDEVAANAPHRFAGVGRFREAMRFLAAPPPSAAREMVRLRTTLRGEQILQEDVLKDAVEHELRLPRPSLRTLGLALSELSAAAEARGRPVIDGAELAQAGGVVGIAAKSADTLLASLDEERAQAVDEIFVQLVNTAGEPVGCEVSVLEATASSPALVAPMLQLLEEKGLVRLLEGKWSPRVELEHGELAIAWSHLVSVRLSEMERLSFRERLRAAAVAWEESGGAADRLWTGAEARELRRRRDWLRGVTHVEREFVDASRRRARRRRLIEVAIGASLAIVVAVLMLGQRALEQRRLEAEEGERVAQRQAYLTQAVARSRRASGPYQRVAWLVEALQTKPEQGQALTLAVELALASRRMPPAHIMTLEPTLDEQFAWDSRWLVARGLGGALVVADLFPRETGQVFEDAPIDASIEALQSARRKPKLHRVLPGPEPMADWTPLPFDTSLVTRTITGSTHVWRLRESGDVALVAKAPMRCEGPPKVAGRAPIVACATASGVALWDIRQNDAQTSTFRGTVLDVSPDGDRVAVASGERVEIWLPKQGPEGERMRFDAVSPVSLGRFSPRDPVIALTAADHLFILDVHEGPSMLWDTQTKHVPVGLAWDENGLDLAYCDEADKEHVVYLRRGARHPDDPIPTSPLGSCPSVSGSSSGVLGAGERPELIRSVRAFGELGRLELGRHLIGGGWKLPDGRYLTRSLLLVDDVSAGAPALRFRAFSGAGAPEKGGHVDSVAAVVAGSGNTAVFQVGAEVRVYDEATGRRHVSRPGRLLGRCADGRVVGYEVDEDAADYRAFVVDTGAELGRVRRDPGYVLAIDPGCERVLTQRLTGELVELVLSTGADATSAGEVLATADGYIYRVVDAGSSVLLAASSGAVARYDWSKRRAELLGYATPRASAIAPAPGGRGVLVADGTGLSRWKGTSPPELLVEASARPLWTDIAVRSDRDEVLLVAPDRVAVLALGGAEPDLIGSFDVEGYSRLSPWAGDGSWLLWSSHRQGEVDGLVIPGELSRVQRAGRELSNLAVIDQRLVVEQ